MQSAGSSRCSSTGIMWAACPAPIWATSLRLPPDAARPGGMCRATWRRSRRTAPRSRRRCGRWRPRTHTSGATTPCTGAPPRAPTRPTPMAPRASASTGAPAKLGTTLKRACAPWRLQQEVEHAGEVIGGSISTHCVIPKVSALEGSYATDPDGPARIREYRRALRSPWHLFVLACGCTRAALFRPLEVSAGACCMAFWL